MTYPMLPSGIKACALREQWSMQPIDPLRRTDLDDGGVAVERKFHRLPALYTIRFELNGFQYDLMVDFWARDLNAGASWFLCPIAEGSRERLQVVRMHGEPFRATAPANGVFAYEWTCEVRDLPRMSDAERIALNIWLEQEDQVADLLIELPPLIAKLEAVPEWL